MNFLRKAYNILNNQKLFSLYDKFFCKIRTKGFLGLINDSYFKKLIRDKKWLKASKVGEKLVSQYHSDINNRRNLARCYWELHEYKLASKALKLDMSLEDIVLKSKAQIPVATEFIESKYLNLGGKKNLGIIEHKSKLRAEMYYTKISLKSDNEKLFYKEIYRTFGSKIQSITPKILSINYIEQDNITLVTTEKVEGKRPDTVSRSLLDSVIRINNVITSIRYKDINNLIEQPDFNTEFKLFSDRKPRNPRVLLKSFIAIHKREANEKLFRLIYERMHKLQHSIESIKLIKRLESIILSSKIYEKLEPEVHYSILHGDFGKDNLLNNRKEEKLYIIDWGSFRTGPSWVDIVNIMVNLKLSFTEIKVYYLSNSEAYFEDRNIEQIFFLYTILVAWFITMSKDEFDKQHENYLKPAINYLEDLILTVKYS